MAWTEEQLHSIQVAERATSVFSLVGCCFIIITFCSSAAIRKPINRLIFYASFGNILTAAAMLIARQGVVAGQHSALCQLQAFFIQQWMPADPLWSFCMALNVYLTFYKRYTAAQLRSLEWKYFVLCYGIPLIPNLIMFFIHTKERGKIYGPATIWCSITTKWQFLRIACFYGPVWLVSLSSLTIFLKVGYDVFRADRNLRTWISHHSDHRRTPSGPIQKVTTVEIQREFVPLQSPSRQNSSTHIAQASTTSTISYERRGTNATMVLSPTSPRFANTEPHTTPAARSYLRYSLLFFIAMVITWLPSSINRIYSLINPSNLNFPLNLLAAIVLPLQGFWNSLIYLTTSFSICAGIFNAYIMAPIRRRRRRVIGSGGIGIPFLGRDSGRERLGSVASTGLGRSPTGYGQMRT